MALALAVVAVIAIDKPQKRKAYKAQSALLLYLSFTMPYVYTKVNLPNRSCIHTHTLTHKHAVCTIKSPTAHHVSFLYAVLFYFGSNQKIHCCHSKCLCTSLSFSFVLGCSEYDRKCEWVSVCSHFSTFLFMQSVKCLYGFHSLFFFTLFHQDDTVPHTSCTDFVILNQFTLIFIRFYCYHFGSAWFP